MDRPHASLQSRYQQVTFLTDAPVAWIRCCTPKIGCRDRLAWETLAVHAMQLCRQPSGLHGRVERFTRRNSASLSRARPAVRPQALHGSDDAVPVMMPDSKWYIMHEAISPVYGDGFVMPGRTQQTALRQQRCRTNMQLTVRQQGMLEVVQYQRRSAAIATVQTPGGLKLIRVDSQFEATTSTAITVVPNNTSMMGVVMSAALSSSASVPLPEDAQPVYETYNTCSPRRTRKVKFTCRRCGAVNIKPVNPHAWTSGSVFAKCGKCEITHKLTDNLKLFHELSGPVFAADPKLYADLDLPPRLQLKRDWDLSDA